MALSKSSVQYASVFLVWALATLCYFSFSHYVHHLHFHFEHHDHHHDHAENESKSAAKTKNKGEGRQGQGQGGKDQDQDHEGLEPDVLRAEVGKYPGYSGAFAPSGSITATFPKLGEMDVAFDVEGLEPNCSACGIHVHSGTTCDDGSLVGGHHFAPMDGTDPWTEAAYASDATGRARGSFAVTSELDSPAENVGRAVVLHASDGARVACGTLQRPGDLRKHRHGRRGDFDSFHLVKDHLFFYGLALPLALLTVAGLVWTGGRSRRNTGTRVGVFKEAEAAEESFLARIRRRFGPKDRGDLDVTKWTLIWFLAPLVFIMFEGAWGHNVLRANERGDGLYVRICMSLMSVSGYGATWALAFFLIPVTKHSPVLDWLRVTPVRALAFHRIAGWTSLWYSILHGYLHLRHLMDVLNPMRVRSPLQQFKRLLIPESMSKCIITQTPWSVFWNYQPPYPGTDEEADQCWLALVNSTGMVSCIAFALLAITSLPYFRRNFYTLFYIVHIPMAWAMLFNAIWHYPTCALILIPNIVYYISLNVPVWTDQLVRSWESGKGDANEPKGALVEANLLEGGSIELIFAAAPWGLRHESSYARLSCPDASCVSHPFSTFTRDELVATESEALESRPSSTVSILLRSKGPFAERMKKVLFPPHEPGDSLDIDKERQAQSCPEMQLDSYYAGTVDWVDRAIEIHDEILIVAGGVGIAPFLHFLPSLRKRIHVAVEDSSSEYHRVGPRTIHLHWYCREVDLASYIERKYLLPHVRDAWEGDPACRGRLKIHLHLTSLKPSFEAHDGENKILANAYDTGSVKKRTFDTATRPVRDAWFMQSLGLRLILPGFLMAAGTAVHWWWYSSFVVAEQFRRNNLVIRSHGIIFSLVLATIVSVLAELILRRSKTDARGYRSLRGADLEQKEDQGRNESVEMTPGGRFDHKKTATAPTTNESIFCGVPIKSTYGSSSDDSLEIEDISDGEMNANETTDGILKVTGGRPPIEAIIEDIVKAKHPGVFSCGARSLIEAVEGSIRLKRSDCALYNEDSEM